jgi:hypothetical protein
LLLLLTVQSCLNGNCTRLLGSVMGDNCCGVLLLLLLLLLLLVLLLLADQLVDSVMVFVELLFVQLLIEEESASLCGRRLSQILELVH